MLFSGLGGVGGGWGPGRVGMGQVGAGWGRRELVTSRLPSVYVPVVCRLAAVWGGLGGGLVTLRLSSVYVLLRVPDVFVLFSRFGGCRGGGGGW